MLIDIQSSGIALTASLLDYAHRRLRFALTRNRDRIPRLVMRVGVRSNFPGADEMFCRLQVSLQRAAPVVIEDAGADLYGVVGRVAERAGREVTRRIERTPENARLARPKPPRTAPGKSAGISPT